LRALLLAAERELSREREVPRTADTGDREQHDREHHEAQGTLGAEGLVPLAELGRKQRHPRGSAEGHRLARGCRLALAHGRCRRRGGHALLPSVSPTATGMPAAPVESWSGSTERAIDTLSIPAGARTGKRVASASAVAKPFNSAPPPERMTRSTTAPGRLDR